MVGKVIVIGAGMGGLSAAIRLARHGIQVEVIEARSEPGGLAGGLELEGIKFDAGPYVLLDRPGLEWAFAQLSVDLESAVELRRIDEVYHVARPGGSPIRFYHSLDRTADELDRQWPGAGARYRKFVRKTAAIYSRLQPIQRVARPTPSTLLRTGAWRDMGFLLSSLRRILNRTGLPEPVIAAIGIWTHVAGQQLDEAPSPLALVPAVIHSVGAYFAVDGIATVPNALYQAALTAGVQFRFNQRVDRICTANEFVTGVRLQTEEIVAADAVISNYSGVGTYLNLLDKTDSATRVNLQRLPLQSPGICAYLAIDRETRPPYLQFYLPGRNERCRLLVSPSAMQPDLADRHWQPARMIAPMDYRVAQEGGVEAQQQYLERVLSEAWWQSDIKEIRVLSSRIPKQWGEQHFLYEQSMNPVMTARFMRSGRIAHRSKIVGGLYLAGSSTHPGQWVSFCAISGILAADMLFRDGIAC